MRRWNERGPDTLFYPTFKTALASGHVWLSFQCPTCRTSDLPQLSALCPTMQLVEPSIYAQRPTHASPEPAWKGFADFKDYVHPGQETARDDAS